jgi:hypothetical protein
MQPCLSIFHGSILPNLKQMEMAIKSVKAGLDGNRLHVSNVKENRENRSDLAGAPQPKKRKAYKLGESRSTLIL